MNCSSQTLLLPIAYASAGTISMKAGWFMPRNLPARSNSRFSMPYFFVYCCPASAANAPFAVCSTFISFSA
jgi:hypothetical protein